VAQARLGLLVEACPSERIDPAESALDRMGRITEDVLWPARRGKGIGAAGAVDLQGAARSAWEMSGTGMGDRLAPAAGPPPDRDTHTPVTWSSLALATVAGQGHLFIRACYDCTVH